MLIKGTQLGKRYGSSIIWKGLDMEITPSNSFVILGGNGSGKSTLLKALLCFETIDKGERIIQLDNAILNADLVRRNSILVGPMVAFSEVLTVKETLEFIATFKELHTAKSIDSILEEIDLRQHQNKQISELSSGMRQRLMLASAFYFKAMIYAFDEPFMNLDQKYKDWAKGKLIELANSKESMFILASNEAEEYEPILGIKGSTQIRL